MTLVAPAAHRRSAAPAARRDPALPRASRPRPRAAGRTLAGLALLAALLLPATLAWAQQTPEQIEARVQAISDMLRCPTCQGISVRDSEAAFSRQIKDKVRRMVEEGQSDEDIKAYFVSRYGEWILRAPKKEGIGLLLWLAPGAALLIAGGVIGWRTYRGHAPPSADRRGEGEAGLSPEQRERIARDLQRFEEEE
jgi:cytochrome c-type biogenesis protein CcmH